MKNFSPTGKVDDSALKKAVRPGSPPCHQRRAAAPRPNFQSRLWIARSAGVEVENAIAWLLSRRSLFYIDVNVNIFLMQLGRARTLSLQKPFALSLSKGRSSFSGIKEKNGASTGRSEEHTSELQSLMRISYAVFC